MKDFRIHFVIIGAAKAGTTSLARWLGETPSCCLSTPKETMFFGSERRHREGVDWYRRTYFSHWDGEALPGEATPAYSDRTECPGTAGRLHAHNPGARLLYMVRNPVKRTESAWRMWATLEPHGNPFADHLIRKARCGFNEWLRDEIVFRHISETSRYGWQWEAWERFPEEQKLTLFLEDLEENKEPELRKVAKFLGIPPEPLLDASRQNFNTAESRTAKTSLRKRVERNPLWCAVKGVIPGSVKRWILDTRLGTRKASLPSDGWHPEVRARFTEAVGEDSRRFLREHGKPENFWRMEDV